MIANWGCVHTIPNSFNSSPVERSASLCYKTRAEITVLMREQKVFAPAQKLSGAVWTFFKCEALTIVSGKFPFFSLLFSAPLPRWIKLEVTKKNKFCYKMRNGKKE